MHECNAKENPNEKYFGHKILKDLSTKTMSNKLIEAESFASTLF